MSEFQWPPPLDVKCTSADCENELHCFKQRKKTTGEQRGKCRYCGADLVDWDRLHVRDFGDVAYTFAALKNEMIRHHFFHKEIDEKAIRHAYRKGRILLKQGGQTPAGQVSRAGGTGPRWSPDTVRGERDLLRPACDGNLLPDVPRVLARHCEAAGS